MGGSKQVPRYPGRWEERGKMSLPILHLLQVFRLHQSANGFACSQTAPPASSQSVSLI